MDEKKERCLASPYGSAVRRRAVQQVCGANEPKRPKPEQGRLGHHGGCITSPTGLDSTIDARRDGGQDGPEPHRTQRTMHRPQPSCATFPTPPTPHRPGKTTTPRLLNPTLRSYCQHSLRNVHCVNCRTLGQPSLPDRARSWSIARARRTRFGRAACLSRIRQSSWANSVISSAPSRTGTQRIRGWRR